MGFQEKPKDINFASEEQKLSEEEDDMKVFAEKNLVLEKPDFITEGNDSIVLQVSDHLETFKDLEADPTPTKKMSKPQSIKPIKDSLDIETKEKLDNTNDLEIPILKEVSLKPNLSELKEETLEVNLSNENESTDASKK